MSEPNKLFNPIFLKDKELRKIMEILFFSYQNFTDVVDEVLDKMHFNRSNHQIIYYIRKNSDITIKELLTILRISKQNLSHSLNQLVKQKYIYMTAGSDKRTKNLKITSKGVKLEEKLSNIQISKLRNVLKNAEENEINDFKKILFSMINSEDQKIFNKLNK